MAGPRRRYAPGWDADAVAMLSARSVGERAGFVTGELAPGMRVLDVGCGPGSISVGLAELVGPGGWVLGIDAEESQVAAAGGYARSRKVGNALFAVADAAALPMAERSADVYFAHALLEHLRRPGAALDQARRVLRPGGLLCVVSSDWSRARIAPLTGDVEVAMAGHHALRRQAGGDPFAGARLADRVRAAGFTALHQDRRWHVDLGYAELAGYVGARLTAAARVAPGDDQLAAAVAAAARWGRTHGSVTQCWVHVLARAPGERRETGAGR